MIISQNKIRSLPLVLPLYVFGLVSALAQMPEAEVRKRLDFIYNGQAERVRIELPSLDKQYSNDAGVRYLDAILTTDGAAAVKKFQTIVDQFPQNEWADDALYKVYQYYYSVGLYKTADQKLDQLKQQYPNSLFIVGTVSKQKPTAIEQKPATDTTKPEPVEQKRDEQPKEGTRDTIASVPAQVVGKFAVQAGAFSTKRSARKQVEFYSTIGRKADLTTKLIGGKTLYVVSIEDFTNEQDARNFIAELKAKYNIESIIVAR
jgi:cell division septation protein DedD